jgi:hypothetical protein
LEFRLLLKGVKTMAKRSMKRTTRSTSRPVRALAKATARPKAKSAPGAFKLTYATMFDPPSAVHERFERALAAVKAGPGRVHPMWIGGKERQAAE